MRFVPLVGGLVACELVSDIRHGEYTDCESVNLSDTYWTCRDAEYCQDGSGVGVCFAEGKRYECDADVDEFFRLACDVCQMSGADVDFFCD